MNLLQDKRFLKFLFPSLIGAFLFVTPIKQGGNMTIPIAVAANKLLDIMGDATLTIIWILISLSAILTIAHKTIGIGLLRSKATLEIYHNLGFNNYFDLERLRSLNNLYR